MAAASFGIVGANEPGDVAVRIFLDTLAGDEIGVAQSHLATGPKPEKFLGRILHEIRTFNKQPAPKRHGAFPGGFVLGIVHRLQFLGSSFRIIFNHHLQRIQHRAPALGGFVQLLANGVFQQADVGHPLVLGHAHALAEIANSRGRETAPAIARDGRHAGIIPAGHMIVLHQLQQLALTHHHVGGVQA